MLTQWQNTLVMTCLCPSQLLTAELRDIAVRLFISLGLLKDSVLPS